MYNEKKYDKKTDNMSEQLRPYTIRIFILDGDPKSFKKVIKLTGLKFELRLRGIPGRRARKSFDNNLERSLDT